MATDRRQDRTGDRRSSMRDRARKRAEERENQGGGGTKYNLPDGMNFYSPKKHASLDIIPYTVSVDNHPEDVPKGELWYQRTVLVHFNVGSENKSYLCPKTIKKKCPICEYRAQLVKDPDAQEEIVRSLKARERELFNVYDREDSDKGVQLWDVSNYNFGAKLEEELREGRVEWGGFAEPVDGFTLKVRFTEEQIGKNKFMQASRIDFEERKSIDKKLLSQALDLDKILKVLPYEQLEKIFLEVDGENGGDAEEESSSETLSDRQDSEVSKREFDRSGRRRSRDSKLDQDSESEEEQEYRGYEKERGPEKASPPTQASRDRRTGSKAVDKPTCPAGGTFGKDCDELEECKECKIWEACIEEQERMAK